MRLVFLGSGAFGLPALQALANDPSHTLLAVVSQPDKPAGRGMKITPTPIAQWAEAHLPAVPLLKPADINEPTVRDILRGLGADAWVVIAFGQKLSAPLLEGVFAINLHASLLPRWRGAAPINAAILAGDGVTGNSVITLAERMDAGLVLGTVERPIDPLVTAGELHDTLADAGPQLVLEVLAKRLSGQLQPVTQDEALVTKARKLAKADGILDFAETATRLRCRVHGLTPWPGVTVAIHHGAADRALAPIQAKLLRVREAAEPHSAAPGVFVDVRRALIACGGGTSLEVLELQPAGGKPIKWGEFVNGAGRALGAGATVKRPQAPGEG
ncbi:MAG: methionyl-tRNA formyltransferase [Phycisphaerales bacterium]|nr:methionyl-tRNA formyltransferase [Phycisphaerales bacterium]